MLLGLVVTQYHTDIGLRHSVSPENREFDFPGFQGDQIFHESGKDLIFIDFLVRGGFFPNSGENTVQ